MRPEERVLDRVPSPASRSAEFPLRLVTEGRPILPYSWRYVQLDQGNEGHCVAFDTTMEAAARPKPFFGDPLRDPPDVEALNVYAHKLIELCQEFDGHRYSSGATQLAGMKAGVARGFWKGYLWATGTPAEKARQTLTAIRTGTICFASDWHVGMDRRDADGYLRPTGRSRGGHSYLLSQVGYDDKLDCWFVSTPNSWGGAGKGRLDEAGLVTLFDGGAEAGLPVNRRPRPV